MNRGNVLTGIQNEVADRIGGMAERMGPTGAMVAERSRDMTEQLQSTFISAMRRRPLATVAAVAVISFALGALWRR